MAVTAVTEIRSTLSIAHASSSDQIGGDQEDSWYVTKITEDRQTGKRSIGWRRNQEAHDNSTGDAEFLSSGGNLLSW